MKTKKIVVLAIVIVVVWCGFEFTLSKTGPAESPLHRADDVVADAAAPVGLEGRVMSVAEFQTWLAKRKYYKGKIDGKVSDDYINSLTQDAWDRAYNDQCGVEDMKAAMGGE